MSGADRYFTNANVAAYAVSSAGMAFDHIGLTTGEKFPDALASGPYLALDGGLLFLTPLTGPIPTPVGLMIALDRDEIWEVSFIAMIEPVISLVKALLH